MKIVFIVEITVVDYVFQMGITKRLRSKITNKNTHKKKHALLSHVFTMLFLVST